MDTPIHNEAVDWHLLANRRFEDIEALNDTVQVIDTQTLQISGTLQPGKGVLHMEFTPRGEAVWISVRDADEIQVYDTESLERIARLPAEKPSGIFFTARAHRTGL